MSNYPGLVEKRQYLRGQGLLVLPCKDMHFLLFLPAPLHIEIPDGLKSVCPSTRYIWNRIQGALSLGIHEQVSVGMGRWFNSAFLGQWSPTFLAPETDFAKDNFCMDWNLPPSTSCPVLLSSGFQGLPSTTHFPRLSPGTSACSHTLHSSVLRSPVSSSVPAAQMCLYFQFGVGFVMHLNRDQRLIFSIFIFQILGQGTLKNNLLSTSPLCETVLI